MYTAVANQVGGRCTRTGDRKHVESEGCLSSLSSNLQNLVSLSVRLFNLASSDGIVTDNTVLLYSELFTEEKDRLEALNSYKEMLSQLPCEDLLSSPPSRRYCPRGIDCVSPYCCRTSGSFSADTRTPTNETAEFPHTFSTQQFFLFM